MTPSDPVDPEAFREFEHAGWEAVAHPYHRHFARLTAQTAGPLLEAVGVGDGMRVLDVASGPGYAAAAASLRGADAVGVDFAAAQVALARAQFPTLEFHQGDAEALPFPDASFDAVVSNFGMLHFARPERMLAEAHRVLRTGGRVAFTVWAKPEDAKGFGIVLDAVETHGDPDVALPPGPPFFRFSDGEECRRVLAGAGFVAPVITQVAQVWRLPAPEALFDAVHEGGVRVRAILRAQTADALEAIRGAICDGAKAFGRDGVTEIPMPAVLASAAKP